ncbi:MAG: alpha/beta hydrolase fold domain-containing protein [Planctomycetaceae bacterium]|nr:alpha/beta hydrolase fold domain-containing protein [Planctomycetaceae bacterium]
MLRSLPLFIALALFIDCEPRLAADLAVAASKVKQIVAHRGSSADRPENTLASTRQAITVGATAVEVDVRTTKDGLLVLSHDATLDRTTNGKGPIGERTLAEIRQLDAGSHLDRRFAGEPVAALNDVLLECRGKIDVLLDLKETGEVYVARVIAAVRHDGDPRRTIVGVRSVEQAREFRRQLPEARQIGLIGQPDEIEAYASAGVETIRLWPKWLGDATLIGRVRATGKLLHLNATTGTREELETLLAHQPDSLSGDDPRQIVELLAKLRGERTVTLRDLQYSGTAESPLLLDLYRPLDRPGMLPVVMWVHGGGWSQGSKARCPATWLTEHGFAVASIDYRLTGVAQWPAQIDDCRAAVRWLREHAELYELNDERIGAWGGSAGGHLVAMLGTLDAPTKETTSSRVQAVCDWYGPTDLLTMPPNVLTAGKTVDDLARSNGAKLLGGIVRDRPELARQASAIYHVSADDPPFLIMHGAQDPGVPVEQSERLHSKLRAVGVPSTLQILPGAGHGGKEFQTPAVREQVRKFFAERLQPGT